ncbi:MAG: molybdenum cofactor guanylyltransferase [Bacteroidales bacterium]|jgi:molybdopterin-guanine dinucleotide biosynthesis protein A|nr:molybdenum cofactor guanylyltransferase [Bacteroidales bacterium]
MDFQNVTGLILAGGQSRRMGRDKALSPIRGLRLIDYAIQSLSFLSPRILISYNGILPADITITTVCDIIPGHGPASGLHASLTACPTSRCLVISTDMPLIGREFLMDLLQYPSSKPIVAAMSPDGFVEPLCAVYEASLSVLLKQQMENGRNKLMDFLSMAGYEAVDSSKISKHWSQEMFSNINTPEDLRRMEAMEGW